MATPDFILDVDFMWSEGAETRMLEKGAFVRPVELRYVPIHVREDKRWKNDPNNTKVFCYTSKGFICIPKKAIRKA